MGASVLECFTALNAVNVNSLVTYIVCYILVEFEKFKSATNEDYCHVAMHEPKVHKKKCTTRTYFARAKYIYVVMPIVSSDIYTNEIYDVF